VRPSSVSIVENDFVDPESGVRRNEEKEVIYQIAGSEGTA
jgi:hypothetical protein